MEALENRFTLLEEPASVFGHTQLRRGLGELDVRAGVGRLLGRRLFAVLEEPAPIDRGKKNPK